MDILCIRIRGLRIIEFAGYVRIARNTTGKAQLQPATSDLADGMKYVREQQPQDVPELGDLVNYFDAHTSAVSCGHCVTLICRASCCSWLARHPPSRHWCGISTGPQSTGQNAQTTPAKAGITHSPATLATSIRRCGPCLVRCSRTRQSSQHSCYRTLSASRQQSDRRSLSHHTKKDCRTSDVGLDYWLTVRTLSFWKLERTCEDKLSKL